MGVGQDEKAEVGDELKALILQERGPADKTISRSALEGRRRPAKQGKPLSGALAHIAIPPPGARSPGSDAGASALPSAPRENRPNDDFLQEALMDPLKFHTRRLTHSQEQSPKKNEKTSITTTYLKHWRSPDRITSKAPSQIRGRSMAGLLLLTLATLILLPAEPAEAHRNKCHRLHSCVSHKKLYRCGDLGFCRYCPNNRYCKNRKLRKVKPPPATSPSAPAVIRGSAHPGN